MTSDLTDREHAALLAEATSLTSSMRSNLVLAHGQLPVGLGLAAGAIGSMIGLLNTDEVGGLAAVFAFMAVAGLAILYDSARIRAEVARMAGVRRAIEQRLELAGGYKRAGLVWEKIHEGDYGGIPRLIAEVESECVSDPVLTNGLALNRRGRRRHYLRGYLDAANSIGLADALWRPPPESPGP